MEQINVWANGVDETQTMDPYTAYPGTFQDFSGTFDNGSQYDYNSSYAHSSAPPSEVDYVQSRGTKSKYYAAQPPKPSRRDSARSVAQQQYGYDQGYYSADTVSPTMDLGYYPTYNNGQDFSQDYFMYASPANIFSSIAANDLSDMNQVEATSPQASSDEETTGSSSESITPPRSHPLYNAGPQEDGLYHCPYAATEDCGHEPKMLKCEYDKYIDSHLKPFRCRHDKCSDLQFSSTACLLRHEREAHEMHGHEESLCEYPPCNRSLPGNGFRRSYNCKDHMSRCHGWVDHNPEQGKKRKSTAAGVAKVSKTKSAAKVTSKKQQIAQLQTEFATRKAHLEQLTRNLSFADGPLFTIAMTQINAETETLKSIQHELSKLSSRTHLR